MSSPQIPERSWHSLVAEYLTKQKPGFVPLFVMIGLVAAGLCRRAASATALIFHMENRADQCLDKDIWRFDRDRDMIERVRERRLERVEIVGHPRFGLPLPSKDAS